MIEEDKGHWFTLDCLDSPVIKHELIFVKREGLRFPGNIGKYPGTTSQEVMRALIARAKYVNAQIPCWPTALSIWLLRFIIWSYEWRAKRIKRKWLSPLGFNEIELEATCFKCGHIRCTEAH